MRPSVYHSFGPDSSPFKWPFLTSALKHHYSHSILHIIRFNLHVRTLRIEFRERCRLGAKSWFSCSNNSWRLTKQVQETSDRTASVKDRTPDGRKDIVFGVPLHFKMRKVPSARKTFASKAKSLTLIRKEIVADWRHNKHEEMLGKLGNSGY